jgi:hypothetical protein
VNVQSNRRRVALHDDKAREALFGTSQYQKR